MSETHPRIEEIEEMADGRLSTEARQQIELHLERCQTCRGERDRIAGTRQVLRAALSGAEDVPDLLRARIAAALEKESGRRRRSWLLPAGLAAAAVLAIAMMLLFDRPDDFPTAAVHDFDAVNAGKLPLQFQTADAAQLQAWFDSQLSIPSRVFDLGMMGYRLVGGRIDELRGRRSALFVYRRDEGGIVICEMFEGVTSSLPPGAERRQNNGIDFFVFQRDGATAIFWQEGEVVCVLASRINRDDVIALAYAKAMRSI